MASDKATNLSAPDFDAETGKWTFSFNMPNIGKVTATSDHLTYYSSYRDPAGEWWYTYNGHTYNSPHYPAKNDGSLESVIQVLRPDDPSTPNLMDDNWTPQGGYMYLYFSIKPDKPFTLPNGKSYPENNGSIGGGITMTINVSGTDTVDTLKERLKNLSGIDIYSGYKASDTPNSTSSNLHFPSYGTVMIKSPLRKAVNHLMIQAGANSEQSIDIQYDALRTHTIGILDTNVLTWDDAQEALGDIDEAVEIVSAQRALFGAYQNRMEHAMRNVDNTAENLQSAESRIRDTDMSKEMVAYSKSNVLSQVSQSMLTQANKEKEGILGLLQQS